MSVLKTECVKSKFLNFFLKTEKFKNDANVKIIFFGLDFLLKKNIRKKG